MNEFLFCTNHTFFARQAVPLHDFPVFRSLLLREVPNHEVAAFFAVPEQDEFFLYAALLNPEKHGLDVCSTKVGKSYPALTPELPALSWFERELFEQYRIEPIGHPRLKPLRFQSALNGTDNQRPEAGAAQYFTMQGTSVHEVAVGPVHAGVIELGHFRFQCMGEDVYSLEIELGYQHRGIEKMLEHGPDKKSAFLAETAAGDSSIAASLCYHRILEAAQDIRIPARAQALRQAALELERIANHIGDSGALSGDVAFLPTASYCGRIRGDFLNITAELSGNRFGRNYIATGGVRYDVSDDTAGKLLAKVNAGEKELMNALDLMFDEPSVLDRFENTGTVSEETARQIGMTGMAARASGLKRDLRISLGSPEFPEHLRQCASGRTGDVLARAAIRRDELEDSLAIVKKILSALPEGKCSENHADSVVLPADSMIFSLEEAWRGMLVHAAVTDSNGKFLRYKIIDPSFHNWGGLEMALRDQQISDFPICNKSFNLSYCGHDL